MADLNELLNVTCTKETHSYKRRICTAYLKRHPNNNKKSAVFVQGHWGQSQKLKNPMHVLLLFRYRIDV